MRLSRVRQSGLGRELVRQLVLDRGMTVLATARRLDRLEALARELPDGQVKILAGDLADATFRQQLWDFTLTLPGGVDLLVNNAGMGHYAEFADQDPQAIRQIIELNLIALIDLSQKAARHMKARGCRPDPPDLLSSRLLSELRIRPSMLLASMRLTDWSRACDTSFGGRGCGSGRPVRRVRKANSAGLHRAANRTLQSRREANRRPRLSGRLCAGSTAGRRSCCRAGAPGPS